MTFGVMAQEKPKRNLFKISAKFHLDDLISFWRSKVKVTVTLHFSDPFFYHNILEKPQGNFFQFGTIISLDSITNWLHFGGQRSKSLQKGKIL